MPLPSVSPPPILSPNHPSSLANELLPILQDPGHKQHPPGSLPRPLSALAATVTPQLRQALHCFTCLLRLLSLH